jgi:hypothetical protein
LIQLPDYPEDEIPMRLAEVFIELLNNAKRRERLAENAMETIGHNRGACQRTVKLLKPALLVQGNMQRNLLKKVEIMKTEAVV